MPDAGYLSRMPDEVLYGKNGESVNRTPETRWESVFWNTLTLMIGKMGQFPKYTIWDYSGMLSAFGLIAAAVAKLWILFLALSILWIISLAKMKI